MTSRSSRPELGGVLGIAVLGSIGTAVYHRAMTDGIPASVLPEAAEASRATLGGAMTAVERLSDALGAALLVPAREAFTDGI